MEFVPVSPKHNRDSNQSPEMCMYPLKNQTEKLFKEEFIASSPLKGQEKNMDDVVVPPMDVFENEIKKRPSNIMPRFDDDDPVDNHECEYELLQFYSNEVGERYVLLFLKICKKSILKVNIINFCENILLACILKKLYFKFYV